MTGPARTAVVVAGGGGDIMLVELPRPRAGTRGRGQPSGSGPAARPDIPYPHPIEEQP